MDRVINRFLAKVGSTGECWIWTAQIDKGGYGRFKLGGRDIGAHLAAYQLFIGPVPAGAEVDHTCHTVDVSCKGGPRCPHRRCVNPAHLEPVTHKENGLRGRSFAAVNAVKTHCPQGHAYDEANTYVNPRGGRDCRTCNREAVRRYKARKTVAA